MSWMLLEDLNHGKRERQMILDKQQEVNFRNTPDGDLRRVILKNEGESEAEFINMAQHDENIQ